MHLSGLARRIAAQACIAGIALGGPAQAQNYPVRAVKIIVGFAPGGPADVLARIYADKLGTLWGQSVLVDNRAGAGGNIGSDITAKAAADGYTLVLAPSSHANGWCQIRHENRCDAVCSRAAIELTNAVVAPTVDAALV